MSSSHGTACELEGLSQAVAGFVRGRPVPRHDARGTASASTSSTARPAIGSATRRSTRIPARRFRRKTGSRATRSIDDSYVLLEDKELDDVALESTHTIDIESFVERDEVDELYLDESYYLVPNDEVGNEAFAVIREAMRQEGLVGLARVVLLSARAAVDAAPRGKGIVGDRAALQERGARRRRTISTTFRTPKYPRTCSTWRSTFWRRRRPGSIRRSSRIATRPRSSS